MVLNRHDHALIVETVGSVSLDDAPPWGPVPPASPLVGQHLTAMPVWRPVRTTMDRICAFTLDRHRRLPVGRARHIKLVRCRLREPIDLTRPWYKSDAQTEQAGNSVERFKRWVCRTGLHLSHLASGE